MACSSSGVTSSLGWARQGNVFSSFLSVAPQILWSSVTCHEGHRRWKVSFLKLFVTLGVSFRIKCMMVAQYGTWPRGTCWFEGIDGMTLGFPATFQFPWIFGFENFSFSFTLIFLSFPAPSVCLFCLFLQLFRFYSGDFDLAPATNFSDLDYSAFQGTLLLRFFSDFFFMAPL